MGAMVYIRDLRDGSYYKIAPWDAPIDNYALFSCGLTVDQDGFTRGMMNRLLRQGKATPVTLDEYSHSGCQSSCVKRGDAICHW